MRRSTRGLWAALILAAGTVLGSCADVSSAPPVAPTPPVPLSSSLPSSGPPPVATTAAPDPVSGGCAQMLLAGMSARMRVAQLFLVGVPAAGLGGTGVVLARDAPGGVFLTGRTRRGTAATATLTAAIQRAGRTASGGVGLFVATDQEGGRVQVLSGPGFAAIPSAKVQGTWSVDRLQGAAAGWGRELRVAGVNVDLAPVGDVASAALGDANAPIGHVDRAFGTDPEVVVGHTVAFVRGMAAAGVASTVKHFPGLGRVRGNTDDVAGVTDSQTTATDADLDSFRAAAGAGVPWLMISSAVYSKIDPRRPAVFSAAVVDLVRGRIGFAGLVVSDDLGNAAQVASVPPGERAVDFIAAGGDVVLTANPGTLGAMIDGVVAAAGRDPGFAARVTDAELRTLAVKAPLGLLPCG